MKKIDDGNKDKFEEIHSLTTRSKYTHKRGNKISKEEKKRNRNDIKPAISPVSDAQNLRKLIKEQSVEKYGPLQLCWFSDDYSKKGMFQGCLVLCGSESGSRLWKQLAHQTSLKVIGRREYLHILLECGLKRFPNDFI